MISTKLLLKRNKNKSKSFLTHLEILQSYNLNALQWVAIGFAVFLLGLSKAGIKGIGIIIVVILAFVFGEKASTGVLLPMLIIADIFAVIYYNRYTHGNIFLSSYHG